jgi:hypothetical protein
MRTLLLVGVATVLAMPAFAATVRVADQADLVFNDGYQFRTGPRTINGTTNPGISPNNVQTFQVGAVNNCASNPLPAASNLFRFDLNTDPGVGDGRLLFGSAPGDRVAPGDTFLGSLPSTGPTDFSCYAQIGRSGSSLSSGFIVPQSALRYVGFYWGSIDNYNFIGTLTQSGSGVQFQTTGGANIGNSSGFNGSQLWSALGLVPFGSYFIEFRFTPQEAADLVGGALVLSTRGLGFEVDNITASTSGNVGNIAAPSGPLSGGGVNNLVAFDPDAFETNSIAEVGLNVVAAPQAGSVALFGGALALAGIALRRRRA